MKTKVSSGDRRSLPSPAKTGTPRDGGGSTGSHTRSLRARLIAAFIAGVLAGSCLTLAATVSRLNKLEMARMELETALGRLEVDNLRMQETLRGLETQITVKKIVLKVSGPPSVYRLEIEKAILPLLSPLIGEPKTALDYTLLFNLLDGRRVTARDKLYLLRVKSILGGEVLTIYLEAVPEAGSASD